MTKRLAKTSLLSKFLFFKVEPTQSKSVRPNCGGTLLISHQRLVLIVETPRTLGKLALQVADTALGQSNQNAPTSAKKLDLFFSSFLMSLS